MLFTKNNCSEIFKNYYDLGVVEKLERLQKGYSNANYKVTTSKGRFFIKIYLRKKSNAIQYELKLIERLKTEGFPVVSAIRNIFGDHICLTKFGEAVVFDFIAGNDPIVNCQSAGRIAQVLARLNLFENWHEFEQKYALNFNTCWPLIETFGSAENQYPELFRYFEEETIFLSGAMDVKLPKGLIHGDVFPDNTIFKGTDLLALLDFEYASTDYLLYDVGIGINGFCFRNNFPDKEILLFFLTSYHKIRKISDIEMELLGYYIQATGHIMIRWHIENIIKNKSMMSFNRANYLMQRVKHLRKTQNNMEQTIIKHLR